MKILNSLNSEKRTDNRCASLLFYVFIQIRIEKISFDCSRSDISLIFFNHNNSRIGFVQNYYPRYWLQPHLKSTLLDIYGILFGLRPILKLIFKLKMHNNQSICIFVINYSQSIFGNFRILNMQMHLNISN